MKRRGEERERASVSDKMRMEPGRKANSKEMVIICI